ncbi:MAG TPA: hypothetical protein EYN70_05025 [Planctomycetaceae bacterium]|nr:hypothetical protein [Planctomycetaceae bacterium]
MRSICLICALAAATITTVAQGAGFAHNDNFIVFAPNQVLAEAVLERAGRFRAQVAKEWMGEQLPPSVGRTVIHASLSETKESGLTWAIDCPERKLHKLWVSGTRDKVLGSTLHHEIVHTVLATRFPDRLPIWAEEGAASRKDDQQRIDIRKRIIDWYARTGNWPELQTILNARSIVGSDQASYSVAASVTEYLLSLGDHAQFLRFAVAGKKNGWDAALQQHYNVASVGHLQVAWEKWASQTHAGNSDRTVSGLKSSPAQTPAVTRTTGLK